MTGIAFIAERQLTSWIIVSRVSTSPGAATPRSVKDFCWSRAKVTVSGPCSRVIAADALVLILATAFITTLACVARAPSIAAEPSGRAGP